MLKYLKKAFQWFSTRKGVPATAEIVKICVIGPPASGKSALVNQFLNALADGSAPRMPVKLLFDPGQDSTNEDIVTRLGVLEFQGKVSRVEMVDTKGALLTSTKPPAPDSDIGEWPPLYLASWDADLLVLVLSPDLLDQPEPPKDVLNHMLAHVKGTLADSPEAMVAIVYSKADEYGIVDPETLRVINDRKHLAAFERFRHAEATDVHRQWEAFLDAVAGPAEGAEKWAELRRILMDRTRHLWEAVAYQLQHRFVNGYFVAAQPSDPLYKPWTRRGIFQLFTDFFDHVQDTRAQPRFGNRLAALLLILGLAAVGYGLYSFRGAQLRLTEARRQTQAYAPEEIAWRSAMSSDSLKAYQSYLSAYPQGNFKREAEQMSVRHEAVLLDDQAWEEALRKTILSAYQEYLAKFPKGRHVPEAMKKISEIHAKVEQDVWAETEKQDSVAGYERYIADHPQGAFLAEAQSRILRLKPPAPAAVRESYYIELRRDWDDARKQGSVAGYRRFVSAYPESILKHAATTWIEKQNERRTWPAKPGEDPTLTEPWKRYVANSMESVAWDAASKKDDIHSYREYLVGYSDGSRAGNAARRIKELETIPGSPR